jgi:Putative MetA-pathway of phenol degradation
VDIRMNQFTIFGTFGLTNRIDLSVAIPYLQVGFNVNSVATINRIAGTEPILIPGAAGKTPTVACCSNGGPGPYGPIFANYFDPKNPATSTVREFSNNQSTSQGDLYWNPSKNSAEGIGDVVLRLKANLYHNDKINFAMLTDVRLPTGDATNFIGSGTVGVKPVAALSVRTGWLTPHVNLGYQWNGSSILGGNPYLGTKSTLPGFAVFSAGSDVPISKHVTLAGDYLGQELVNSPRIGTETITSPGPLATTGQIATFQTIVPLGKGVYNQSDAAVGVKISAWDHLLFTANAIVALNDGGLRQRVTPLLALSYVF